MRILRLAACYAAYAHEFYAQRPSLAALPYAQQYRTFMDDCFGWNDAWTRALRPLGHEMWEPVFACEPMQRTWAREASLPDAEKLPLIEIAIRQAQQFKPDVLWVTLWDWNAGSLQRFRQAVPSLRLIAASVGGAMPDDPLNQEVDLVLSCAPESVAKIKQLGGRAEVLSHPFDTGVLRSLKPILPDLNFTFLGSLLRGSGMHENRETMLARLGEECGMEIFSPQHADYVRPLGLRTRVRCWCYDAVKNHGKILPRAVLERLPIINKVNLWPIRPASLYADTWRRMLRPPVWGLRMYQTLLRSKATFNMQPDGSSEFASNMRLFEATGMGVCLLTDWKQNLVEFFEPDREVVTYRTTDECVEKAKYLMEHESERLSIARAGQARCLRDHTFERRAPILEHFLKRHLN